MKARERLQQEIEEMPEVLSRRSGQSIAEVWNEALTLHRCVTRLTRRYP
jgi:hypothetical protein